MRKYKIYFNNGFIQVEAINIIQAVMNNVADIDGILKVELVLDDESGK